MYPMKRRIAQALILLFTGVAVVTPLFPLSDVQVNILRGLCGLMALAWAPFVCERRTLQRGVRFALFLTLCMALSLHYTRNAGMVNLLWIWSYWGVALLLFSVGPSLGLARTAFALSLLLFAWIAWRGVPDTQENLLSHGSANNLSALCIFCLALCNLARHHRRPNGPLAYLPILLIVFVSAWVGNRSGILCGAIYLPLLFWNNVKGQQHGVWTWIRNGAVVLLLAAGVLYFADHYAEQFFLSLIEKTDRQGFESIRPAIWREYAAGAVERAGNLLFGVPGHSYKYPYLNLYDGNTHNAFLMLHAKFGLAGAGVVLFLLVRALIRMVRRRDRTLLLTFVLIAVRSCFDWTAFPGLYDVLFWYFVLYALHPDRSGAPCTIVAAKQAK